jgi:microcin C transport system substrate-binding protein
MRFSRREIITGLGSAAALCIAGGARAGQVTRVVADPPPAWQHGISLFENLKYAADFKHFEYVNPQAPKAGMARQGVIGTFDSFNMVVAGVKGDLAAGIELIYESLMASSLDEVSSEYGQLAEAVSYPSDHAWVRFRLRPHARWHDGSPVSPDDVIFSLEAFKQWHPQLAAFYRRVVKAEQTGTHEITFTFDAPNDRELPLMLGQLMVLPRHWWTGTDAHGRRRNIGETTLEPPLGSGPYRIKSFEPGRMIVYERVPDYWGRDLPVNVGSFNFAELRFDYFRDSDVEFEAFKAGAIDWRTENAAKNWATGYDFPAVLDKQVLREEFPIRNMGVMQAFAFNLRRGKFRDARVRRAFNFAFNFQEINRELFYNQYQRIVSYFEGTDLAAGGLPSEQELALLQPLRSQVPPDVFTTPYWNPVARDQGAPRANLREAMRLFNAAGFEVRDFALVDRETGEPMQVEFLVGDPSLERVVLFYRPALERLGITADVRLVDDAQYINRLRGWDFDIIVTTWDESLTPGNEQRDYWGSRAADVPGSRNLLGIKNAAVDALINSLVRATTREELVAATRALDRVLLWNHYVVPQWTLGKVRTARWDRFAHPPHMPRYGLTAFPTLWWWHAGHAEETAAQ